MIDMLIDAILEQHFSKGVNVLDLISQAKEVLEVATSNGNTI